MVYLSNKRVVILFIFCLILSLSSSLELPLQIIEVKEAQSNLRSLTREEIEVRQMKFNIAIKDVHIGYPPQSISLLVSMNTKNSWLIEDDSPIGFNRKKSLSFKIINETGTIRFKDGDMNGIELTDTFAIGKVQLYDYPFLAVEKKDDRHNNLYNGALGLGFNYKEEDLHYSFIELAKKAQIVSKSIYSFNLLHPETGTFTFGEYPKELNSKSTRHYRTCSLVKVNENEPNIAWECLLDSVYFENVFELYQVKANMVFSIGNNSIMVPEKFWDYFLKTVANKFIVNLDCKIVHGAQFDHLTCNDSFDVNHFGSVSFVIGKYTFTIPPKALFTQGSRYVTCVLYHLKGYNKFLLGLPLFREYLSVFDKETAQVGLVKYSHLKE